MSSPADKVKKVAYDGLGRVLGFLHSPKAAARRTAEDTKALPLKVLTTGLVTAFKVKKKLAGAPAAQPERDFAPIAPVTHLVPEPAPAERAPAPAPVKTVAKKVPAKKVPAKKVPAKKVIPAKTPAKKAPVKKAPAKKTTAPKTPEK